MNAKFIKVNVGSTQLTGDLKTRIRDAYYAACFNSVERFRARMTEQKTKFVVLAASYNNEAYIEKHLQSVLDQTYNNYRVIYIDDCSTDKTAEVVNDFISAHALGDKFQLVRNKKRRWSLEGKHIVIHDHCLDDEVVVILDGDDNFSNNRVLEYLNSVYVDKEVWLTYGSYYNLSQKAVGQQAYTKKTIDNNVFRVEFHPSHLRTFRSWMYKQIPENYLKGTDGRFFRSQEDRASMYALIELSGYRHRFIPYKLMIYNDENPIGRIVSKENRRAIRSMVPLDPI